jgi:hypothetical protein
MDPQLADIMKRQRRKGKLEKRMSSKSGDSIISDDTNEGGGEGEQQQSRDRNHRCGSGGHSTERRGSGGDGMERRGSANDVIVAEDTSGAAASRPRERHRAHRSHRERRPRQDSDSRTVSSRDSKDSHGSADKKPSRHASKASGRTPRTDSRRKRTERRRRTSLGGKESSDHTLDDEALEESHAPSQHTMSQSEDDSSSDEEQPPSHPAPDTAAAADGFASFGDADVPAFASDFGGLPASEMMSTDTTGSGGDGGGTSNFEAAFGSFPTDFGAFPAATETTNTPSAFVLDDAPSNDDDDDYHPPSFDFPGLAPPPPPRPIYDKSPIDNPPKSAASKNAAIQSIRFADKARPLLHQSSTPAPVANPLDGHLILCRKNSKKEDVLCEWNPHTRAQVASIPILSQEFQRKVAAKYSVSVRAVDNVLTLAVGLHRSHGYTRPRVAALLDLLVQDNNEVLRLIAIWQWGYGSSGNLIQLQTVVGPPSGSDFSYNTESLSLSDSCIFVSGASAKGPCVFLCKPTIRDTWSANFVGKESARIASMTTTITSDHPYLAIALTDGSLSIWTYEAATRISAKTTEALRRLLFPLCKLEGTKLLRQCQPTGWGPNDTNVTAGKCR